MIVRLHPEAAEEFLESVRFYEQHVDGLGELFIQEFERLSKVLMEYPQLGAPYEQQFRRTLMARFPYSIVYSVEPDAIWIIAVAHQRRRPGYWRNRAPNVQ